MSENLENILVSIIMGSKNDLKTMLKAEEILNEFKICYEVKILSAHRSPNLLKEYLESLNTKGVKIIIAGAGNAAHLAGVLASHTTIPVIAVPLDASLMGLDALLSSVQMPVGIPVATVGINNSKNAAFLAVAILALNDEKLKQKLIQFRKKQEEDIKKMNKELIG